MIRDTQPLGSQPHFWPVDFRITFRQRCAMIGRGQSGSRLDNNGVKISWNL